LVSGDHSFTSTSTLIAFRHPKRYPQDSSLARPNTLANHQSNLHSIAPLQGRTPSQTTRATSIQSLLCKAKRPLQPTRTTTCPPATIPCTGNRSRTPQLRTCEPLIPPLRTFEPSNLRTSEPPIKPPHGTKTTNLETIHSTYTLLQYRENLRNTYAPGKHLNSDLKPPETSIFLRFSSDFYTELLRFPIYTLLCRRRVFATK
jgi:hypothetical protein